jgi:hypothetical protein
MCRKLEAVLQTTELMQGKQEEPGSRGIHNYVIARFESCQN